MIVSTPLVLPGVLLSVKHAPDGMSAVNPLRRNFLCALVAHAIICDVEAAAAAGQKVLRGARGVARELAREQGAVVGQRGGVVARSVAGLLRSVLQCGAAGAHECCIASAAGRR